MCLGVVAILLLNDMEVFSVGGGALLDIPCMVFQRPVIHRFSVMLTCSWNLGVGGVGGVGGEWIGDLDQSLDGWGGAMPV